MKNINIMKYPDGGGQIKNIHICTVLIYPML